MMLHSTLNLASTLIELYLFPSIQLDNFLNDTLPVDHDLPMKNPLYAKNDEQKTNIVVNLVDESRHFLLDAE